MGASTIAIRPLQDFHAKVGSGRLFDMGGSTVNYGSIITEYIRTRVDKSKSVELL